MANQEAILKLEDAMLKQITHFVIDKLREEESAMAKSRYAKKKASTKLLMRNYRSLADHCESAIYDTESVDQGGGYTLADILDSLHANANLEIESIRKSAVRTQIIMDHIDIMLEMYKTFCDRSPRFEDARRYRVIYYLYLSEEPRTHAELAEDEKVDKSTIYRDVDVAIERLTALIFGIDGLSQLFK